jgi:mannitol-1-phosphate/altronate dehydrogenase
MDKQTENYIVLKPIAERFNKVAETISDEDIKSIIKEAMKEQILGAFDFDKIGEITDEYIDTHSSEIENTISESTNNRINTGTNCY